MIGATCAVRPRLLVLALAVLAAVSLLPAGMAAAHPLGNFSVSHLSRIVVDDDAITIEVIIDAAEIPTSQDRGGVDANRDGVVANGERDAHAAAECGRFIESASLELDGEPLLIPAVSTTFNYKNGQAGLQTSRLECSFAAAVPAGFGGAEQQLMFEDRYRPGRVGWHEINAVGIGVGIIDSPVPTESVTDGLQSYPDDLLESPLDIRRVVLDIGPDGVREVEAPIVIDEERPTAADARDSVIAARPGWPGRFVDGVQGTFDELIGSRDLTLGVGLLAIGLSLVLGASHALLPGHGKTVMAAYIAGRQGSARDAVLVGATVTLTHTGGVLLLGLGLTVSTALAGESVLSWLGMASGVMIAGLGLALLASAIRRSDTGWLGHGHHHGPGGHTHDHGHHHVHVHHHHDHHDPSENHAKAVSRGGLVGMGVAGGLVPSPSALIVLLSAIALGRTWFGVVLVVGYGLGMAVVLTLAGIVLVKLRDRLQRRLEGKVSRTTRAVRQWARFAPVLTASLVVVVGVGLAVRSLVAV